MSIKKVCDRCNKVKEEGEEDFDHVEYIVAGEHKERSCDNKYPEYDLCPECAKQFRIFINGGTVEEDRYKDSKPCSVVIHKLADGNYGIEDIKDDEKDDRENYHDCATCRYGVMNDSEGLSYAPCIGSDRDHEAHWCASWERRCTRKHRNRKEENKNEER